MFSPSEFISFIKHPNLNFKRKESDLFGTAFLIYLSTVLFIGIISFGLRELLKLFFTLPVDETLLRPDRLRYNIWIFLLMTIFFVPVMEETVFRLSLIFKPIYLSLSLSVLISLFVHTIVNKFITIIVFLLFFILIYRLTTVFKTRLVSFWNRNFQYLFYSLSILFGLVHIGNYNYTIGYQYIISPLLVFPQIAIGFVLSFIRIFYRKGFFIGIIYHIVINMISVSIFYLSKL